MSALTIERLRAQAQALTEEISLEGYLAHSGQKSTAELQPIYQRHAAILGNDALEFTRELFREAPPDGEARRGARMLLEWQVESQAGKVLAPLDEREIAWESSAFIPLDDGRQIQYQAAAIEIANATDRAERLRMDEARATVVAAHHAPMRLEHLQREKEYVESLEIAPGYNATFETLSGVALLPLAEQCSAFLRDTQAMWDETLAERLRRFGVPRDEATRSDSLALFRAREFDDAFPGNVMESTIRRNCADMGIDASAGGHVVFDLGERAGKRSRAFCAPVRVPQEVYLVLRPHGGQSDYNTLLHELGHALHFGYARSDYPFEYRWLGDNSVTEGYAMLFDHRMQDRGWLLRYTSLGSARVGSFLRAAAFEELHFLRRYCAKLLYEVQVYGGAMSWHALPELYVEMLSDATGFRYRAADAFVDLDPRYYSTRYLRAWQLQAVLNAALTEQFNEDWYRNPAAGPFLVQHLFGEGQREMAEEIATRAGAGKLSFAPLVQALESQLAG